MFSQRLRTGRTAMVGLLAIGTAVAFSTVTMVRADTHRAHPDKNKTCNSSGPCQSYTNVGTGPAFEAFADGTNTRAMYAYATNSGSDGADINGGYIGIIGRAPASSGLYPLVLTDSNGTDLDFTDTSGNIFYHGSLIQFMKTRHGAQVGSYASHSTSSTLEDVGSARLVNGQVTVALDRSFADTIDLQSPYHVFLTPNGDTRGLYVAQKTATSFVVRETQGGHGTLTFDYRVVGSELGRANQHMGMVHITEPDARLHHR